MCMFSGKVEQVKGTNIFARLVEDEQILVYSMDIKSQQDIAMILPLPVAEQKDEAIQFINLEKYPKLFKDLKTVCYPPDKSYDGTLSKSFSLNSTLKVHNVGDFIASFVPSVKDFDRVDPQFKLSAGIWDQLPQYANYGFAVFQLKKTSNNTEETLMGKLFSGIKEDWQLYGAQNRTSTIHPMGFKFKTALKNEIFFPTVHIHDGEIKAREMFDHTLYLQAPGAFEAQPIDKHRHPTWQAGKLSDLPGRFPEDIFDLKSDQVWSAKYQQIFDNKDVFVKVE